MHILPQIYRRPEQIFDALTTLAENGTCATPFVVEKVYDSERTDKHLFVARLGDPLAKKRVLVVANVHAREAVAAEVAVTFVERVCGVQSPTLTGAIGGGSGPGDRIVIPEGVAFTLVPVANVGGRKLVDTGANACQRNTVDEGEGEIDLNRNADVDFDPGLEHGPRPFSAYQARIIRDLADDNKTVAFVDLHSGSESLLVPWGNQLGVSEDFDSQEKLLKNVASVSCPACQIGSNRVVVDYPNPGGVIDHMYAKKGIIYSTLWEVYNGGWDGGMTAESCLKLFVPPIEKLPAVVRRWSDGLSAVADFVDSSVLEGEHAIVLTDAALQNRTVAGPSHSLATLASPSRLKANAPSDLLTT